MDILGESLALPYLPNALFLEEILKSLAGVIGTGRGRGHCLIGITWLNITRRCGVFLDGHAELVELAVVLGVLRRNAFRNGLRAFELCPGIEEAALLAAVQLKIALGTLALRVEAGSEYGAAIGAAGAGNSANHARR